MTDTKTTKTACLRLVSPGQHTRLVDAGRPRTRRFGVPVGGAADRISLALGNALVDNAPEIAALEITLAGPTIETTQDIACVVFGAPFEMVIDSGRHARPIPNTTFTLQQGERLLIRGVNTLQNTLNPQSSRSSRSSRSQGARAYFCVHGGIEGPIVLNSRSSLGPLQAGALLSCSSARTVGRFLDPSNPSELLTTLPRIQEVTPLRMLPGAHANWFSESILDQQVFTVSSSSDRMGLRLEGIHLPTLARHLEMASEPVCPGTVQVTREGLPIILGVDGQTIGGYPKIAQVISADRDRLGQLRPGDRITFVSVPGEEAEQIYRTRQRELNWWIERLRLTAEICRPHYS